MTNTRSISIAALTFLLTAFFYQTSFGGTPDLEAIRLQHARNRQLVGNATAEYELSLRTNAFGFTRKPSRTDVDKIHTKVVFARDKSWSANVNGGPVESPSRLMLKEGGLWRYFPATKRAICQSSIDSKPDWSIDPFTCLRASDHRSVFDIIANPLLRNYSLENITDDEIIFRSVEVKSNQVSVTWEIQLDAKSSFMPTVFQAFINDKKVLSGNVVYRLERGFVPVSWFKLVESTTGKRLHEERGELISWNNDQIFSRSTSSLTLPVGTKVVNPHYSPRT